MVSGSSLLPRVYHSTITGTPFLKYVYKSLYVESILVFVFKPKNSRVFPTCGISVPVFLVVPAIFANSVSVFF